MPKEIEKFAVGWMIWFVICALAGLGMFGLIAWALIRVVLHYT